MLTTQQIQAKLEENFELLTKLVNVGAAARQEPAGRAVIEEWSKTLHDNLMQLAGQADANQQQQQQQAAPMAVQAVQHGAPVSLQGTALARALPVGMTPTGALNPAAALPNAGVPGEEGVPHANRWDTGEANMSGRGDYLGAQGKSKRRASGDLSVSAAAAAAVAELHILARHAHANIQHKNRLPMFVPVAIIIRLRQEHNLLAQSDVDKLQHTHAAKSH